MATKQGAGRTYESLFGEDMRNVLRMLRECEELLKHWSASRAEAQLAEVRVAVIEYLENSRGERGDLFDD